jgi:hypothetical protein
VVANFQPDPKNYGLPTGTDNGESLFNHQTQPSPFSFSKVLGRDIRSFHSLYLFINYFTHLKPSSLEILGIDFDLSSSAASEYSMGYKFLTYVIMIINR